MIDLNFDRDGYPSDEALAEIRTRADEVDATMLADLLRQAAEGNVYAHLAKHGARRWAFTTGGWSGNEDLVDALAGTEGWRMSWQSSHRGGRFVFEVQAPRSAEAALARWNGTDDLGVAWREFLDKARDADWNPLIPSPEASTVARSALDDLAKFVAHFGERETKIFCQDLWKLLRALEVPGSAPDSPKGCDEIELLRLRLAASEVQREALRCYASGLLDEDDLARVEEAAEALRVALRLHELGGATGSTE